jgi:hypothetical protein
MRASNLAAPTRPTFRPKLRKVPRRSLSTAIAEKYLGEKFGELLLKKALWFAQHNKYDLTYLIAYPKQAFLIDLLSYYGFKRTKTRPNGELVLEMSGNAAGTAVIFANRTRLFDGPLTSRGVSLVGLPGFRFLYGTIEPVMKDRGWIP